MKHVTFQRSQWSNSTFFVMVQMSGVEPSFDASLTIYPIGSHGHWYEVQDENRDCVVYRGTIAGCRAFCVAAVEKMYGPVHWVGSRRRSHSSDSLQQAIREGKR